MMQQGSRSTDDRPNCTMVGFRKWWVSVFLGLTGMLILAAAQSHPSVAVVDPDRIRLESVSIREGIFEISRPAQELQESLQRKNKQLRDALETYESQKTVASEQENQKRGQQIRELVREVERIKAAFEAAMAEAEQEGLAPIRRRIVQAVEREAHDRGIELVLSNAEVIFAAERVDLTDEVIARLDADEP